MRNESGKEAWEIAKGDIRFGVFEWTPADVQIGLLRYSAATYREGDEFGAGVRLVSDERNWPAAVRRANRLNAEKGGGVPPINTAREVMRLPLEQATVVLREDGHAVEVIRVTRADYELVQWLHRLSYCEGAELRYTLESLVRKLEGDAGSQFTVVREIARDKLRVITGLLERVRPIVRNAPAYTEGPRGVDEEG